MHSFIQGVITQQAESLKHLLNPESKQWSCTPEFSETFSKMIDNLMNHYFKRAALFGAHRIDTGGGGEKPTTKVGETEPEQKKKRIKNKQKMEIRESDFDYAWQTIEQDAVK